MSKFTVLAVLGGLLVGPGLAAAQPLGSFRWQLQPYCNVITLTVVQQGGQFTLDGSDDQCGAARAGGARGMAFQHANGLIGFGLTIVTAPSGTPVHLDATISMPSLNGTWRDSAGNSGQFIFGAGIPGGGPRPVPAGGLAPGSVSTTQIAPAAITNVQIAPGAVTGASIANGSVTLADLAAPPALAGILSTPAQIGLTGSSATIRTVTLQVPASGTVVASAAGLFGLDTPDPDAAWCSITTTTIVDEASLLVAYEYSGTVLRYVSFGGTRFFNVSPGTFTVRLVCTTLSGTASVLAPSLSALFIPG